MKKGELTKVITVQITTIHKVSEDDLAEIIRDDLKPEKYEKYIKDALCADDVKVQKRQYFVVDEKE